MQELISDSNQYQFFRDNATQAGNIENNCSYSSLYRDNFYWWYSTSHPTKMGTTGVKLQSTTQ